MGPAAVIHSILMETGPRMDPIEVLQVLPDSSPSFLVRDMVIQSLTTRATQKKREQIQKGLSAALEQQVRILVTDLLVN